MATVAVHTVGIDEIGNLSPENEICTIHSQNMTETNVAESSESIEVSLMKKTLSNDSGILMYKSHSDVSSLIIEEENDNSINVIQSAKKKLSKQSSVEEDEHFQNNQFFIHNRCLQENKVIKTNVDSNLNAMSRANCDILHNSNEISNSCLKISKDENVCSSISNSLLLIKTNQNPDGILNNINSSKLSFPISNIETVTEKQCQNLNNDLVEYNSCKSLMSSHFKLINKDSQSLIERLDGEDKSRSASQSSIKQNLSINQNKNSVQSQEINSLVIQSSDYESSITNSITKSTTTSWQSIIDKSDDKNNLRQSKSSSWQNSPEKQSQNSSNFKRSQCLNTNVTEDTDFFSSTSSSISISTNKNSQSSVNTSDNESNSKQSKSSSWQNSPEKQGQNSSNFKRSQCFNTNVTEDNDSFSSTSSSISISINKNSQLSVNTSDNESNSKQSKSLSTQSSPEKQSQNNNFKRSQIINIDSTEHNESPLVIISSHSKSIIKDISPSTNENISESQSVNRTTKLKKYFNILDSDSEEDILNFQSVDYNKQNNDSNTSKSLNSVQKSKIKSVRQLVDSDSEEEVSNKINENLETDIEPSKSKSEVEDFQLANVRYFFFFNINFIL
jgi:hypothetical protein